MNGIECPVRKNAVSFPEGIAILEGDIKTTYKELDSRINGSLNLLKLNGIEPGMNVGVLAFNGLSAIVLFMALMRMGAVPVPVNHRFPPSEIRKIISGIGLDMLISSRSLAVPGCGIPILELELFDHSVTGGAPSEKEHLAGKGLIFLTSGSTGEPKGVLLSPENIFYNALGANMNMKLHAGDRWLLLLPLFHVGGMGILFRAFIAGATVVLPRNRVISTGDSIAEAEVTYVSMVSTQLEEYVDFLEKNDYRAPALLKAVLTGGGMVPDSLVHRAVKRGVPVYRTYGLTEMASQVTTTGRMVREDDLSSSGKVLKYREISVSKTGEVLVKGECLFQAYISGGKTCFPRLDRGGWFPTGDSGKISGTGDLYVTGRMDHMFISGGENIFPEEIEKELLKMNEIADAVVVPVSDEKYGMRPLAFIHTKGKDLKKKDIDRFLRKSLPGFKVPGKYYHLPPIEEGRLKRERKKLKILYEEGTGLKKISD